MKVAKSVAASRLGEPAMAATVEPPQLETTYSPAVHCGMLGGPPLADALLHRGDISAGPQAAVTQEA